LKFYVNETYEAETETIPRRWSLETRPRRSRKYLETETFETETTTLVPSCQPSYCHCQPSRQLTVAVRWLN